jgi:hypothetical protein
MYINALDMRYALDMRKQACCRSWMMRSHSASRPWWCTLLVLGMLLSLKKKATASVGQSNAWHAQCSLSGSGCIMHAWNTWWTPSISSVRLTHTSCAQMARWYSCYIHDLSHTYLTLMPDIGASMLGLSGFIMHGLCRGLNGLHVFQPGTVHAVGS